LFILVTMLLFAFSFIFLAAFISHDLSPYSIIEQVLSVRPDPKVSIF
jgi:hypothetical protein